ncbi:MAG: NmrA family NAD(P)-binding protein [Thermoleophilia bacterium]|nr:NmrA family NAD(P)-binding protein [Thermoleophilia bacterium]
MNLVVGASGMLGSEICRLLAERGRPVRALVRAGAAAEKVDALRALGVELVEGDLRERASLDAACAGATAVLSTATTITQRREGDSFAATDRDGQIALVDAATAAGAEQFVFVSFGELPVDNPLQQAKRAVEQHLERSGLAYTILRPGLFCEIWLSPAVGFDHENGRVRVFGSGERKINWISFRDVAAVAVAALDAPAARDAVIELGGDYLSPREVIRLFEETTGRSFSVETVPEEALRAQVEGAPDELSQTFSALMLNVALGHPGAEPKAAAVLGVQPRGVRDFAADVTA